MQMFAAILLALQSATTGQLTDNAAPASTPRAACATNDHAAFDF